MTKKFLIMHQLASIRKRCILQDEHDKLRRNDNNIISVLLYYNESAWLHRRWRWRKRWPKTQFQIYFPPTPGKRTGTYSACVLGVRLLYWHHGEHVLWGWKRGKKSVSLSVNWEGGFDPCSFKLLGKPYHSKVFFFLGFLHFFSRVSFQLWNISFCKNDWIQVKGNEFLHDLVSKWNPQYCKQPY